MIIRSWKDFFLFFFSFSIGDPHKTSYHITTYF